MSKLTQCNFCSHQDRLRRAKQEGMKVTIMPEDFGLGGVGEYIHPKDINIKKLSPHRRKKYHAAWYMNLGSRCEC